MQLPIGEIIKSKYAVKPQGGNGAKEGSPDPSDESNYTKNLPGGGSQGIGQRTQTPFFNPDPFQHWHGVENVAKVRINGESCMAFLDNGVQINTIMPSYKKSHSLEKGLITDLISKRVTCIVLGNAYTQPLGYVIVKVQVDGVQGYNEEQIVLVVPGLLNFVKKMLIILRTPTISHVVNVMKEREIDALVMPWVNARVAHLLSVWKAAATMVNNQTLEGPRMEEYDEVVVTKNMETVDTFSSHVIPMKAEKGLHGGVH